MSTDIPIIVSVLALALSSVTAWLTLGRKGTVKMTQPTVIFFGPDGSGAQGEAGLPKVYLRTLLFATSKRGRVVENMFVTLSRHETQQNFNIWVYGDGKLVRGSGLFVGESGMATSHHFLLPKDSHEFRFIEGEYSITVYAHLLGDRSKRLLFSQKLTISHENGLALQDANSGLYFDWGPDSSRYFSHIDIRRPKLEPDSLIDLLRGN